MLIEPYLKLHFNILYEATIGGPPYGITFTPEAFSGLKLLQSQIC